ncbi:NADH-quinone oxidoreductase subunit L [Thermoproteus tenax]|uniref:NADH dehydrogenase I chain L n=1 Tax=Thermoproteus tenax (strain ATCC 35583 / DSM 2078 / JCM 9277 / NBRC 100435 / Kra 1) TaxID=768679 RepID=G4RNT3_THETK|nr:NADH-quinone oxidoreductase subunit L [Thermoproteus tenax]CCC81227.1 NADH dehydrogenase I chain L [Thermoproteus tenax Kra 1]
MNVEYISITIFSPLIASILSIFLPGERAKSWLVVFGAFISAVFSVASYSPALGGLYSEVYTAPWIPQLGLYISYHLDQFSGIMGMLVAWLVFFIVLYSVKYMEGDYRPGWYWFFMGFFATSMLLITYADNLWFLLMGWEGVGLASWALIGHWYKDDEPDVKWVGHPGDRVALVDYFWPPSKAGLRAILTIRTGDSAFILSLAYILAAAGTVQLSKLYSLGPSVSVLGLLPLFLFLMGPLTKSAQFPFTEWLLTAMTGPTSVSALIHAATMVNAGVYLLIITAPIFAQVPGSSLYFLAVLTIGALTAVLSSLIALAVDEFKLVLAGSTATNLGIIAAAAGGAGLVGLNDAGALLPLLWIAFMQIVGHAISKAPLFMGYGAVIHEANTKYLGAVGRLSKYMRVTSVALFLAMLSLVGTPPLAGFFTKEMAVDNIVEGFNSVGIAGIVVGGLIAFLAPLYGLRLIGLSLIHGPEPKEHIHEAHPIMWVPYTVLALSTIGVGAYLALEYSSEVARLIASPGFLAFLAGFLIALVLYVFKPGVKSRALEPLWRIAYRRFYLPWLYDGPIAWIYHHLAHVVYWAIDRGVFDNLYHVALPAAFGRMSAAFRRLQTGSLSWYLLYAMVGVLILVLLALV